MFVNIISFLLPISIIQVIINALEIPFVHKITTKHVLSRYSKTLPRNWAFNVVNEKWSTSTFPKTIINESGLYQIVYQLLQDLFAVQNQESRVDKKNHGIAGDLRYWHCENTTSQDHESILKEDSWNGEWRNWVSKISGLVPCEWLFRQWGYWRCYFEV